MRLTRVTITGADDDVDPQALYALSREFDFVEWGILRSRGREGTARYPSVAWRQRFAVPLVGWRPKTALHLCGEVAREALAGNEEWPGLWHYDRIQLNGFSKYRLPYLRFAYAWPMHEVILQCQWDDALSHAAELAKLHPNVTALYDVSGGRGILDFDVLTMTYAPPGLTMGRAGGLNPENIAGVLDALRHVEEPFWVDMESGVRTDDKFDLDKVRAVLEIARSYVTP